MARSGTRARVTSPGCAGTGRRSRPPERKGLTGLLAHAVKHSPFHRERLAGLDVDRIDPLDLSALPVMTKHDMMSVFDDVVTNRSLNLELVEEALAAAGEVPATIDGQYVVMASGGSSGQRGVFVFDRAALVDFILSLSRGLLARLEAFGGPPPRWGSRSAWSPPHRLFTPPGWWCRSATPTTPRSGSTPRPPRCRWPRSSSGSTPPDRPPSMATPRCSIAWPENDVRAASTSRRSPSPRPARPCCPKCERPSPRPSASPSGTPSARPKGWSGRALPGEEPLTFNSDLCIVELVDEDDQPVPSGTPSAKVLVTNLYNRAQPLIRYELTDSFVRQPDAVEHGHFRACVEGRTEDPLRYDDVDLHPHAVRAVLVATAAVLDYQVRQTRRGIEVDALASGVLDVADLRTRLTSALATAGLRDPKVDVRVVDNLERNAATGKLRRFLPLPVPTAVR